VSAAGKPAARRKPRILCVDDEPAVLEGLELGLGRTYDIAMAGGGAAGLEILERDPSIIAIVSDMRMPSMDGAKFLAHARERYPDATRILLTGQADMASAIAAVNDGQIFRFLTKPCAPPVLVAALAAACEQHRLITAERVLLEQTLHGSIKALTDVLALLRPVAFGAASRIKRIVCEIADAMQIVERWQVEVAAMLCQLGSITLPETPEKTTPSSDAQRAQSSVLAEQLLASIPRLEAVRGIIAAATRPHETVVAETKTPDPQTALVVRGAAILRSAVEFEALETRGNALEIAFEILRSQRGRHDPAVLDALAAARKGASADTVEELPVSALRPGMVFAEDVRLVSGPLLVARGGEVTASFLARAANYPPKVVPNKIWVFVKATTHHTRRRDP
jgi:CheY-like chemotaxis protein